MMDRPIWRKELTEMVGYDIQKDFKIYELITVIYKTNYPEHAAKNYKGSSKVSPDNIMKV